jgi:hypothetical protein
VLLIKQYEGNSKQLNFILNQINVIIYSYQHCMKKYLPWVFLNFTNLKQQVVVFLIFEWTLDTFDNQVVKLDFCFLILSKLNRRQICRLYLVIFMRA